MRGISKSFSLLIVFILAVSSLMMAKPTFAQTPTPTPTPSYTIGPTPATTPTPTSSTSPSSSPRSNATPAPTPISTPMPIPTPTPIYPMPSVPEFTATGLYGSVELIIRNQQFNSAEGSFMYNVRLKDHNETDDWVVVFNGNIGFPSQSNSNYTIISIPVPNGAQIDVQVNAMIGAVGRVFNPNATSIIEMYPYVFVGATSGWSNTKTVTIPLTPPNLTPAPSSSTSTQTPTLNGAPSPSPPVFTATGLYGSVELTIINQQFNSSEGSLYYNVQLKDHNETDDWVVIFDADNGYPAQSNSNYTIISIPTTLGAQIDVQVNAMIGTVVQLFYPNATSKIEMYPYAFGGSTSGWSDTQTVTISQSPTPLSSTSVSSSLNLSLLITAIAVIALLLAITIFLLYIRKRKTVNSSQLTFPKAGCTPPCEF